MGDAEGVSLPGRAVLSELSGEVAAESGVSGLLVSDICSVWETDLAPKSSISFISNVCNFGSDLAESLFFLFLFLFLFSRSCSSPSPSESLDGFLPVFSNLGGLLGLFLRVKGSSAEEDVWGTSSPWLSPLFLLWMILLNVSDNIEPRRSEVWK